MSVYTEADEKLDSTKGHLQSAIEDLSAVVIGECWGTEDYSTEYRNKLRLIPVGLMGIKARLSVETT